MCYLKSVNEMPEAILLQLPLAECVLNENEEGEKEETKD
jgi:hypothetical protein